VSVTFYEVARRAGVSTATVSRVLNNKGNVRQQTVDRIMETVRELGYYPNAAAKSLAGAGTRTIGMVLPPFADLSFPDSFTLDFLNGVQTVLASRGFGLLLLDAQGDPPRYFDAFRERRIEGLIALESLVENDPHITQMRDAGFPLALVSEYGGTGGAVLVDVDIGGVFMRAASILKQAGTERACFVIYDHRPSSESKRFTAANAALEIFFPESGSRVLYTFGLRFELYRALLAEMTDGGFDGFFVDSPYFARRVAEAARETGRSVPGNISILALDYNGYETTLQTPPIDALYVSSFDTGRTAANFVFDAIEGKPATKTTRIEPQYSIRGSVAPVQPPESSVPS